MAMKTAQLVERESTSAEGLRRVQRGPGAEVALCDVAPNGAASASLGPTTSM